MSPRHQFLELSPKVLCYVSFSLPMSLSPGLLLAFVHLFPVSWFWSLVRDRLLFFASPVTAPAAPNPSYCWGSGREQDAFVRAKGKKERKQRKGKERYDLGRLFDLPLKQAFEMSGSPLHVRLLTFGLVS